MQYVSMAIVGLIVGALARLFYPGAQDMSWIMTAVLGIAGSFLAGLVGSMIHKSGDGKIHPAGFVYSILGALILIFLAHRFGFA